MSNISSAPLLSAGTDLVGGPSVAPPAAGPLPATSGPAAAPHARLRSRPAGRLTRVLVVESGPGHPDRLDAELDVVARLPLPLTAEDLHLALAAHRPKSLLCKHSLDQIDERFMAACRSHNVDIFVLAHPVYGLLGPVRLRRFGGLPWLRLRRRSRRSASAAVKRGMDLSLALLGVPVLVPLMFLLTLAVWRGGPPLYFQDRVGEGGRPFRMVKFRTMRVDAERDTGPVMAGANDARVNRTGRFLRRYRLDELPQLWNVLRGQMSLVGPRPERPEFVAQLRALPHYDLRHLVRPGITGIAQLTGGYAATAEEKLRCDLLYLHCRSARSDLKLLLLTVAELLRGFPRG